MTRDEQLNHWIEKHGRCNRPHADCNSEKCIYKAVKHGPCMPKSLYSWAMAEKKREGMCVSIW